MGNSVEALTNQDLQDISEKTSISLREVKAVYKEFQEIIYLDQKDSISKETFAFYCLFDKRYRAKVTDFEYFIEQLFEAFDRDSSGALSFQEFLIGKRLYESDSHKENLKFIFRLFDLSKDNRIEKSEIELFLGTLGRLDTERNAQFAQEMMDDLDFDKNGSIDEDEFIEGILKNEKYMSFLNSIFGTR